MKNFIARLPRLLLLLVVIYLVSQNYRQQAEKDEQDAVLVFSREKINGYFPEYTDIEKKTDVLYEVKKGSAILGKMIVTSPVADDVMGFGGSVPLALMVADNDDISGMVLLENFESPDFIETIAKTGFFEKWNGKNLQEALELDVEGVSGASMTTDAVKAGVKKALVYHLQAQEADLSGSWWDTIRKIMGGMVVVLAVASMLLGGRLNKYRLVLLSASLLILGVASGYFVSFALLFNWLVNGIPFMGRILLVTIAILAFLFPLLFGKAWYCYYLCPFGAAQELAGKLNKKKWHPGKRVVRYLKYIRTIWFIVVIGLLLAGLGIDLTQLEPFSAFMFTVATPWIIILSIIILFFSLFLFRPWCNYFCLTGFLLDFLQGRNIKKGNKRMLYESIIWLFFAFLLLFVLW